jgi:hypothetical protein
MKIQVFWDVVRRVYWEIDPDVSEKPTPYMFRVKHLQKRGLLHPKGKDITPLLKFSKYAPLDTRNISENLNVFQNKY